MEQTEQTSLNAIEAARQAIKAAKEVVKAAEALKPFVTSPYDRQILAEEAHDFSIMIYGIVGGSLYFPIEEEQIDEPIEALLQKAEELISKAEAKVKEDK